MKQSNNNTMVKATIALEAIYATTRLDVSTEAFSLLWKIAHAEFHSCIQDIATDNCIDYDTALRFFNEYTYKNRSVK